MKRALPSEPVTHLAVSSSGNPAWKRDCCFRSPDVAKPPPGDWNLELAMLSAGRSESR